MGAPGQVRGGGWAANGGEESLLGLFVVAAVIVAQIVKGLRQYRRNRPGTNEAQPEPRAPPSPASAGPDEELRRFLESLSRPTSARASAPRGPEPKPPPQPPPRRAEVKTAAPSEPPKSKPPKLPERLAPERPSVVSTARQQKAAMPAERVQPAPKLERAIAAPGVVSEDPYAVRRSEMAAVALRRRELAVLMAHPRRLRRAILAREILGPPVAMR